MKDVLAIERRRFLALIMVCAVTLMGAVASERSASNHTRLLAMPLAQRQLLAEKLNQFRALGGSEQEALRELDRQINAADPDERERYWQLAHRYRLWLDSVPEKKREQLQEASPEVRVDLLRKQLDTTPREEKDRVELLAALSPALNPLSLLDQAHYVKIWLALSPKQKDQIRQTPELERPGRLDQLGRQVGVKDERDVRLKKLSDEVKKKIEDELRNSEEESRSRSLLPPRAAKKVEANRKAEALKRADALRALTKAEWNKRLGDVLYLGPQEFKPVDPRTLARFIAVLPSWTLETLDVLPPDAARRRLVAVYRLIYPDKEMPEIPAELTKGEPVTPKTASPARTAPADSSTSPF